MPHQQAEEGGGRSLRQLRHGRPGGCQRPGVLKPPGGPAATGGQGTGPWTCGCHRLSHQEREAAPCTSPSACSAPSLLPRNGAATPCPCVHQHCVAPPAWPASRAGRPSPMPAYDREGVRPVLLRCLHTAGQQIDLPLAASWQSSFLRPPSAAPRVWRSSPTRFAGRTSCATPLPLLLLPPSLVQPFLLPRPAGAAFPPSQGPVPASSGHMLWPLPAAKGMRSSQVAMLLPLCRLVPSCCWVKAPARRPRSPLRSSCRGKAAAGQPRSHLRRSCWGVAAAGRPRGPVQSSCRGMTAAGWPRSTV
mmetsp:Transcript_56948/g.114267  ORF Transcript_56948/g.114267 Transcript_56948/m.114267 type:complete len:304 (+) Transcript_56948:467-1378(+)